MTPRLLALDFGGSKIEAVQFCASGVRKTRIALEAATSFETDLEVLQSFLSATVDAPPNGVAVAFPGLLKEGRVVKWPNRPAWEGHDLIAILRNVFPGGSLSVEEDANLGAIASKELFANDDDLIFVNAGTGIGCGIIMKGQLVKGKRGLAGELGHTVVAPNACEQCSCGKRGCLQLYASGRAIERRLAKQCPSESWRSEATDKESVISDAARALALAVSNMVCLLDITQIHLGGGLAHDPQYGRNFVEALRGWEAAFLNRKLSLVCGALKNASLFGALLMAAEDQDLRVSDCAALRSFLRQERLDDGQFD
jgi:predicted NBD/HSP70 family sugar kinase